MSTLETTNQLVIAQRPIVVQLYTDGDGVWARLSKYFSDVQLSANAASKMAAQYVKENPESRLFRQAKFAGSAVPEWCVKLSELESFLRNRRQTTASTYLWKLYDAWNASQTGTDENSADKLPLEEVQVKKQHKKTPFSYHVSVNAFNYEEL